MSEMLTAEQYARALHILCCQYSNRTCEECPLASKTDENGITLDCVDLSIRYPAESAKLVHLWWNENKHRFSQYERGSDA